jgi:hypothetical protein
VAPEKSRAGTFIQQHFYYLGPAENGGRVQGCRTCLIFKIYIGAGIQQ